MFGPKAGGDVSTSAHLLAFNKTARSHKFTMGINNGSTVFWLVSPFSTKNYILVIPQVTPETSSGLMFISTCNDIMITSLWNTIMHALIVDPRKEKRTDVHMCISYSLHRSTYRTESLEKWKVTLERNWQTTMAGHLFQPLSKMWVRPSGLGGLVFNKEDFF